MDDSDTGEKSQTDSNKPMPDDFNEYLPWSCRQMLIDEIVLINKVYQNEYVSVAQTERSKSKKSKIKEVWKDVDSNEKLESVAMANKSSIIIDNVVTIETVYDCFENLIELRFPKSNKRIISQKFFKLVGLILNFQHYLTALSIHGGLDRIAVYELSKFIPQSNITDLSLDNTVITGANFDLLLEQQNRLQQLSLARCKINDDILENIATKLIYPSPSSKTLIILNLSSNLITDVGAKFLAKVLRSNRKLAYLNLSGNMLTDDGAAAILDVLIEFPVTSEEIIASRSRQLVHLQEKQALIHRMMTDLRLQDVNKIKKNISRMPQPGSARKGKIEKEGSLKSLADAKSGVEPFNAVLYDRAKLIVDNLLGSFSDPFARYNLKLKNGVIYCSGNNTLSYINFAYNNLSYMIVKMLYKVIRCQKMLDRRPKGLVNVCIEGNNLPVNCRELWLIDDMLYIALETNCRKQSSALTKKKSMARGKWDKLL